MVGNAATCRGMVLGFKFKQEEDKARTELIINSPFIAGAVNERVVGAPPPTIIVSREPPVTLY